MANGSGGTIPGTSGKLNAIVPLRIGAAPVEHSRAKGHEVALGDGVEHLRGLEPAFLGAVVAIEVIEHVPYERLIEFLELARLPLRPGGVLLLETVNPHAVDAMKAFWVDPTHQHPVFPEVALELCRLAGFAEAFSFWFHPIGTGEFETTRICSRSMRSRRVPARLEHCC